jgi:hypothetical protein
MSGRLFHSARERHVTTWSVMIHGVWLFGDEGHWQFSLWDNIPLGPRGLQIAIIYGGNVLKLRVYFIYERISSFLVL